MVKARVTTNQNPLTMIGAIGGVFCMGIMVQFDKIVRPASRGKKRLPNLPALSKYACNLHTCRPCNDPGVISL